jgi:hypothetical protein
MRGAPFIVGCATAFALVAIAVAAVPPDLGGPVKLHESTIRVLLARPPESAAANRPRVRGPCVATPGTRILVTIKGPVPRPRSRWFMCGLHRYLTRMREECERQCCACEGRV